MPHDCILMQHSVKRLLDLQTLRASVQEPQTQTWRKTCTATNLRQISLVRVIVLTLSMALTRNENKASSHPLMLLYPGGVRLVHAS